MSELSLSLCRGHVDSMSLTLFLGQPALSAVLSFSVSGSVCQNVFSLLALEYRLDMKLKVSLVFGFLLLKQVLALILSNVPQQVIFLLLHVSQVSTNYVSSK